MASLSEKLSILTNPAPNVLDPEDEDNIEIVATNEHKEVFARSKAAADELEYAGKKVSLKSLDKIFQNDEKKYSKYDRESDDSSEENEDLDSDDDDDDELSDGVLENFKSSVKKHPVLSDGENEKEEDDSTESEASDIESTEDMTKKFSNIDVVEEKEKAAAVKAQQALWHRFCEARIKLQKLLILSNRLPQADCWSSLKKSGEKEMLEQMKKSSNSVKLLLNKCLDVQGEILQRNPEINSNEYNSNQKSAKQSDEEIPSDTEEEMEDQVEKNQKPVKKILKRKLKCEEYGEILAKRHKSLMPYRNSVIQKWDEKTKLSSGKLTQKSFLSFESSAVKQIDQILQDEARLIKRTQLKRSFYRVLGKPDDSETKSKKTVEKRECTSKQDMLLRDYDAEIFDDEDFYRQMLKDVIQSKSVGIDPAVLRKQLEIVGIRSKIKKKVDTKASKGRKIRYDVHQKLVGFMKKMETTTLQDTARNSLLKSFFGKGYIGCL